MVGETFEATQRFVSPERDNEENIYLMTLATTSRLLEKGVREEPERDKASRPLPGPQLVSHPPQACEDEYGPCPILEETSDAIDGDATT